MMVSRNKLSSLASNIGLVILSSIIPFYFSTSPQIIHVWGFSAHKPHTASTKQRCFFSSAPRSHLKASSSSNDSTHYLGHHPDYFYKYETYIGNSNRRSFIKQSGASLAGVFVPSISDALTTDDFSPVTQTSSDQYKLQYEKLIATGKFDCLLNLPPVTPGCARLYLCRHGQTENNRLRLVQGARVDPSINSTGDEQAQRIGIAVSRLNEFSTIGVPSLVAHSKLRRARETAQILTTTAAAMTKSSIYSSQLKIYGEVPFLNEVDFGSLEGQNVNAVRAAMMSTFAYWAGGNIDRRPPGGDGESGREVFERCAGALDFLGKMAMESSGERRASNLASHPPSILAVSHSTYLRILLAIVEDTPLASSMMWKIQNGSVNVVDVNVEGKKKILTLNSNLFGSKGGAVLRSLTSRKGKEIELVMPEAHLIRRNEVGHLNGMEN